jgi:hypothetical protein
MQRIRWRWVLPIAQLILAIALWACAPYQYLAGLSDIHAKHPNEDIQLGTEFYLHNWPTSAEQVVLAMNFPAAVLAGPLNRLLPQPLYAGEIVKLTVRDVAFFFWIVVLWAWIGAKVDNGDASAHRDSRDPNALLRFGRHVCALVFALILGAIATEELLTMWPRPATSAVAACGLLWAIGLGIYFGWRIKASMRLSNL